MANKKNGKVTKTTKPTKKQAVSKEKSKKKTTEKKSVKKNILTSEKKDKKTSSKPQKTAKKSTGRPPKEKTKKTTPIEETTPVLTTETKSEAIKPEEVLNASKQEPSITPVVEEEKKVEQQPIAEVKKEVSQPKNIGILPVDDDEDDKTNSNTMNTVNTNVQKVFTFNKGLEFMEGHLKINIDGTNISRRNDLTYDVYGKSENGAEFKTEFECIDKEEGDFLLEQLMDCEKNPTKYASKQTTTDANTTQQPTTTTPANNNATPDLTKTHALDAQGNIDMTKLSAEEIMSIQSGNMNKVNQNEPKKDFTGIPLSSVNIDDMINNLPPKPENQNINPINVTTQSTAANISNIINNQNAAQLEAYGKSIEDLINTSFQANVWGGMPQNDARLFLKNCDAQYTYELLNDDGKGFFIKMKRGSDGAEIRIPKNPTEYLKVK